MKRFLPILIMLACLTAGAQTHVRFCVQDFASTTQIRREVLVTPSSLPTNAPAWLLAMDTIRRQTATNGCFTISNMVPTTYWVGIVGGSTNRQLILVGANQGLVDAATLVVTNASSVPMAYTTTAADAKFATYAWSMALSNALYVAGGGGSGDWGYIGTNALTENLVRASNMADGGFQVNSNRIGLWDDQTWGTVDNGANTDGVEHMVWYIGPAITTDTTGISSNRLLFFNGPPYGDPASFMPLTNSDLTTDDATQLHSILPKILTNAVQTTNIFMRLHVAETSSVVKTFIFSNRVVMSGFGGIGTDGSYLGVPGGPFTNTVTPAWVFTPPQLTSNGVMRYTDVAGDMSYFSDQGGGQPTGSGRFGLLTLDADPPSTNSPVRWRDTAAFQPAAAGLTNQPATNAFFQAALAAIGTNAAGRGIGLNVSSPTTTIELTNRITVFATNSVSNVLDFASGTTWYSVPTLLVTNLVLSPTNLISGREIWVQFGAANGNYDVTITNAAANAIHWAFNNATNGSTSFTVTNGMNAELSIIVRTNSVIHAVYGHYR